MSGQDLSYAITGATGNIGGRISERLLSAGKQVRVIGRSMERLQPLVDKGAEAFEGTLEDADFLRRAFDSIGAVFSMIPPPFEAEDPRGFQKKVSDATVQALRDASVCYVVSLSSVGAQHAEKNGPIAGLHYHEQNLNGLEGVNIVHLRPVYFMENLFMFIQTIKNLGVVASPIKSDLKMPMIATADIAAEAAGILLDLDFSGKSVKELLGERDLTLAEVARVFGPAIGRSGLQYVQVSFADAQMAMLGMGLSRRLVDLYLELMRGFNEGIVAPTQARTAENTTPTSIEGFSEVFATAFNG